jgi:hypothetical protein
MAALLSMCTNALGQKLREIAFQMRCVFLLKDFQIEAQEMRLILWSDGSDSLIRGDLEPRKVTGEAE